MLQQTNAKMWITKRKNTFTEYSRSEKQTMCFSMLQIVVCGSATKSVSE